MSRSSELVEQVVAKVGVRQQSVSRSVVPLTFFMSHLWFFIRLLLCRAALAIPWGSGAVFSGEGPLLRVSRIVNPPSLSIPWSSRKPSPGEEHTKTIAMNTNLQFSSTVRTAQISSFYQELLLSPKLALVASAES